MIVIACNTASAMAYETVKKFVGGKAVVVNVISPVTRYVAKNYPKGKIGVIGTKGTIRSRIYVRKIFRKNPKLKVSSLATPLLAPMIEEGFYNNFISRTIIHSYLSKHSLKKINAIILACTHYPLIRKDVEDYYKRKVEIIDSSEIVALFVKEKLSKNNLLNHSDSISKHQFFVSDYTEAFEKSAKMFFKEEIQLKKVKMWR